MGVMEARRRILLNTPHIVTPASAGLVNFSTDMIAHLKECKVHFTPVQQGSGDPSPENIRPITGWTGVEAWQTGKNLVASLDDDEFWSIKGYFEADGVIRQNGRYRAFDYTSANPNTRYVLSNDVSCWMGIGFYDASKGPLNFIQGNKTSVELMAPSNVAYVRCYVEYGAGRTPQLEIATTATAYEPYNGTTLPVDWADSAGAVYGGYVDLVSGELVSEWVRYVLDGSETWTYTRYVTGGKGFASAYGTVKAPYSQAHYQLCSHMIFNESSSRPGVGTFSIGYSGRIYMYVPTSIGETAEEWAAYLKRQYDNNTQLTLCYRLNPSASSRFLVSASAPKALRGTNNIWSNANGNIDLSYWTH